MVGMFLQAAFVLLLILFMRRCLPQAQTRHVPETQVIVPHSYCNGTVPARDQPEEAQQTSQHKDMGMLNRKKKSGNRREQGRIE